MGPSLAGRRKKGSGTFTAGGALRGWCRKGGKRGQEPLPPEAPFGGGAVKVPDPVFLSVFLLSPQTPKTEALQDGRRVHETSFAALGSAFTDKPRRPDHPLTPSNGSGTSALDAPCRLVRQEPKVAPLDRQPLSSPPPCQLVWQEAKVRSLKGP